MDEIKTENILRIRDKKLLEKLNKMYDETKGVVYTSKNNFLNDILKVGIQTFEKQAKDNWAIQHEKQTLLDAIHAHTKRMNYFIKFSKPFIKTTYANTEILLEMLSRLTSFAFVKMPKEDKERFLEQMKKKFELMEQYEDKRKKLFDLYDFKVEENERKREQNQKQDLSACNELLQDEILLLQQMLDEKES